MRIEIDAAERIVGADLDPFLEDDRALIEPVIRPRKMVSPVLVRPWMIAQLDRGRPAVQRQQRGMELDHAVFPGIVTKDCGRELRDIGHDAEFDIRNSLSALSAFG